MIEHGTVINNRYRVGQLLGKGGFGEIFEVDDGGTPKVIKFLSLDSLHDPEKRQKALSLFQREAEILKLLNHPGIPRCESDGYFTWQDGTLIRYCLVMEKIDGQNLEKWFEQRDRKFITQEQAIDWLKQLLEIVEYLHHHNYIHRDIKPPNIMVKPNGQLVLIDFGTVKKITDTYISKLVDDVNSTSIVSHGYTPLEQRKRKPLKQSDFFALGCTLVYLLTGISPEQFDTDDDDLLIWRHHAPTVGDNLASLIARMIAPLHRERPQDTQIILKYLETLEKEPSVVEDKQTDLSVNNRDKINKRLSASLKYGIAKFIKISSVVKAALALGVFLPLGFFSGRYFLPGITLDFYNRGFESFQAGDLDRAESYYRLALFLDPNFAEIYFSLGKVHEKRYNWELAEAEYQKAIALKPDFDKAYNNLGRLYIHKKQYAAATPLLKQGLELTKDKEVEFALLKNFGWALKEQEKYEEAKIYLQKSIALDKKRAPAYCLWAQILESQGNKVEVGEKWKNCLRYASEDNPDEKIWKNQAQKRLQPQNTQK